MDRLSFTLGEKLIIINTQDTRCGAEKRERRRDMEARVLQVVTYMGRGGLETMLMNYYRRMDRSRVQFDFLVHRAFEADYDQEILKMGGRIYRVPRLVPWSRAYRGELRRFFAAHPEYRIVHVHQDCLSAVALQCARESGVPVRIAHSHNAAQDRNLKYLVKRHYMKQIPAHATHLFACSRLAGDWMFGGAPYQVLPNAVDVERFRHRQDVAGRIREEFRLGDAPVIGHVGRFQPQKNHRFLIDVFAQCVKREPRIRMMLVGDGEGKEAIRRRLCDLGLADRVIFTGVRADVNALMQAMDVFVFPSLYEGLPVTMIEAQAAGLHCVISDRISAECVVTDGLVTRMKLGESPESWAECILKKARLPREDHSQEIRAAGYDIDAAAGQLETFYIERAKESRTCHC